MNLPKRLMCPLALILLLAQGLAADDVCRFEVLAGIPLGATGDGGLAASAYLFEPHGISTDSDGNLFIADTRNHRIRRVGPDGIIRTIAGNGVQGQSGDGGDARDASLSLPEGVLAAEDGSVYIADTGNHKIRKVDTGGRITTIAGTGQGGFTRDGGQAVQAQLNSPRGMALARSGALYFADSENNRIRRIDLGGDITTVAGSDNPPQQFPCCSEGDQGLATSAHLRQPRGLAIDSDGTVYIADTGNLLVRRVGTDGIITTIAGTAYAGYPFPKYPAPAATPLGWGPGNVALLADGSMLIPDWNLLRLTPDQTTVENYASGISTYAAITAQGGAYLSGLASSDRVVRIAQAGATPQSFAGRERFGTGSNGGPSSEPVLHSPTSLTVGPDGAVYAADYDNQRIVRIQNGAVQKVASAQGPLGVAVDAGGTIFIADYQARLIRKVTPDGATKTIAGGATALLPLEGSPDVPATSVEIRPIGIVVHPNGNVYAAVPTRTSYPNPLAIVRVTPEGQLKTIFSADGRGGISLVGGYRGLALDPSGNLLLGLDSGQILRLDPSGAPVAGNATVPAPPFLTSVASDPSGSVYYADRSGRVVRISSEGSTILYNRGLDEYLGTASAVFSGNDPIGATSLATDRQGNLYVSQRDLHRVLKFSTDSCAAHAQPKISAVQPTSPASGTGLSYDYAAGELISLYGTGMGPAAGTGSLFDANGLMATNVAGVRVLFNGLPGPLVYVSAVQINAIIPFSLAGRGTARVQVETDGVLSDAFNVQIEETAPSLFSVPVPGGARLPIVVNPDGSLNAFDNPAPAGSIVILYGTGMGKTSPDGVDGHLAASPAPLPVAPVTTEAPFSVLYAGGSPGIVEGVIQINLQLPKAPFTGTVRLKSGAASTDFYVASK